MPSAKSARATSDAAASRPAKRSKVWPTSDHVTKMINDHAADVSDLPAALAASVAASKVPKFLRSLYAILQTEDPRVISWVQNKELKPNSVTAFHILEMERFEREILPKYFKHQKFASFQRQLNNFGFRKWTKTQSSGVCTFSHNCFPPDLSTSRISTLSVREQWRQKSSQVIPPTSLLNDMPMKRRFVGNGIAKGRNTVPRKRPVNVQVSAQCVAEPSSLFTDMYRSPNSNSTAESSAFRHGLSFQPPSKKLARPSVASKQDVAEPYTGLEGFCDDSYKQYTLPPLQPHHLVASTPRSGGPSPSSFSRTIDSSCNGFRFLMSQANTGNGASSAYSNDTTYISGLKPFDMKHMDTQQNPYVSIPGNQNGSSTTADAAAMQGAFLEPWIWDAQVSSANFEVGSFSLEFDCKNDIECKNEFEWQESTSCSSVRGGSAVNCGMPDKAPCHRQDRAVPSSSEEFGLDNLLFVE